MFDTIVVATKLLLRAICWCVWRQEKLPRAFARELTPTELCTAKLTSTGAGFLCNVFFVDYNDVTMVSCKRIERCLRVLMRRHPLLRARIAKRRGRYYWYEPANLRPRLRVDLDTDWRSVMLAFTPKLIDDIDSDPKIDCEKYTSSHHPLWWLQFLPSVTSSPRDDSYSKHGAFLFYCHHAIADGQGFVCFMRELRQLLTSEHALNEQAPPGDVSFQVPDSLETLARKQMTIIPKLLTSTIRCLACLPLFKQVFMKLLVILTRRDNGATDRLLRPDRSKVYGRRTGYHWAVLSRNQFRKMHGACKAEGVTVNSILQAAAMISATEFLSKTVKNQKAYLQGPDPKISATNLGKISVSLTAQLDKALPIPTVARMLTEDEIRKPQHGCISNRFWIIQRQMSLRKCLDASRDAVWTLARDINTFNHKTKKYSLTESINYSMLLCEKIDELFESPLGPWMTLHFSNLGNCTDINAAASNTKSGQESTDDAREGAQDAREGAQEAREGAQEAREGAKEAREGAKDAREGAQYAREGAKDSRKGAIEGNESSVKVSAMNMYSSRTYSLFANFIKTINETLVWSVLFPVDVVSAEDAQRFSDRALEILDLVC